MFLCSLLIWPKPPGKARWKTRVRNINERMALAQQGKWKTLLDLSMKLPLPTYEPTPEDELLDEHGLSTEMARKLHAAACQGQVGKAWKQMRSPLPPRLLRKYGRRPRANSSRAAMHPSCSTCAHERDSLRASVAHTTRQAPSFAALETGLLQDEVQLSIAKVTEIYLRGLAPKVVPELGSFINLFQLPFGMRSHLLSLSLKATDWPRFFALPPPDERGLLSEPEASSDLPCSSAVLAPRQVLRGVFCFTSWLLRSTKRAPVRLLICSFVAAEALMDRSRSLETS